MKRLISLAAIGILTAAGTARAEDGGFSGQASLGAAVNTGDKDTAKFREYWYDMHSMFSLAPEAHVRYEFPSGGDAYFIDGVLVGESGLQDRSTDGNASLEAGSYGLFKVKGEFTRIGHNFAFGAKSLYSGIGTGTLTLPDSMQQTMQNINDSNARAAALTTFDNALANPVDLMLRRDQVKAGIELQAMAPFTFNVDFAGEQRRGERPYGANFGFSNAIEIAEPIDYDTVNVTARASYADVIKAGRDIPLSADVALTHSDFMNNIPSVYFENPLRWTDSPNGAAPAAGRNALPPSNQANTVIANFNTKLPYSLGLSGHATLSRLDQNAPFIPQTTNSFLAPQPLFRQSAEANVDNSFVAGALTMQPVNRLGLKVAYSYREHKNNTPEYMTPQVVNYDSALAASSTAEVVSSIERVAEFEQVLEVANRTHITTAFENEHSTFIGGSSSMMNENSFKLSVDTQALDWLSARVSALHAVRDSDYPDYTAADGELPWMRKYYAAARDRDQVVVMTSIAAAENLDITLQHIQGLDDYTQSEFGLQKDQHQASTVDVSYDPGDGVSVSTFFSQESYLTHQRSRQWNPGGVGDPYGASPGIEDPSNWTVDSTTVINTIGMSTSMQLIPDKLSAQLQGTASAANGKLEFTSPLSSTLAAVDNVAFYPQDFPTSDNTKWVSAGMSLTYQITKSIAATLAYRYDFWKITNALLDGYTPVAMNGTGGYNSLLSMDTMYENYSVHTLFARISTTF